MDGHLNLNRREDAFSFEPHVLEAAQVHTLNPSALHSVPYTLGPKPSTLDPS